jgi:RimJ/RimL family protein N-acetyltransferase
MSRDPAFLLRTDRLELRAATAELCRADLEDRARLARDLQAVVPSDDWPPPLLDPEALNWCRDLLTNRPDLVGWCLWYVVALGSEVVLAREAIGVVGFKGPPSSEGLVEVGYSIRPVHQGLGLGTEAVRALIFWAFRHSDVRVIQAQTLPDLPASIGVLSKIGFGLVGPGDEPGSIRFDLPRSVWERTSGGGS